MRNQKRDEILAAIDKLMEVDFLCKRLEISEAYPHIDAVQALLSRAMYSS